MTFEVRVYKPNGVLKKIITKEELAKRADAILHSYNGHSSAFQVREQICDWQPCSQTYWKRKRAQRYCSKECSNKAYKENSKRQVRIRTEERRQKREATSTKG